ncbi:unnamed protein product [Trichogramma brassicae]|uniref:Uncharacterized protein n=1 Tax=Trichogramma brassicae TaxID=86971 RepID=A0A6H5HW24_9HYME|nr:unnamed protein product [Trichogramma brassicae]
MFLCFQTEFTGRPPCLVFLTLYFIFLKSELYCSLMESLDRSDINFSRTSSAVQPTRNASQPSTPRIVHQAYIWVKIILFYKTVRTYVTDLNALLANFRGSFFRLVWSSLCPRWSGYHSKRRPGYVISLRSGKKTPITVRAGSDRITISRSPRRGLTRLAIDGAQHSHDEVRSENHTHKRALDAGAKAQQERMMAPEARTTLTR